MTKPESLSPRQRRFVAAMMTARTVTEAAEAAGVSERTGRQYLTQPAVKAALSQALDSALHLASRQSAAAMTDALATLQEIHQDPTNPAGSRVSAARAILEAAPKLREALDLAERVTELEKRIQRSSYL